MVGVEVRAAGDQVALGVGELVDVVRDDLPAVDVHGPAAPALVVLGGARVGGVGRGEHRAQRDPVEAHLLGAVQLRRRVDAEQVEQGRQHVDRVAVLVADLTAGVEPGGPRDDERVAHAALERVALEAPHGGVAGLGPAPRVVVVGAVPAELVDEGEVELGVLVAALGEAELADRAVRPGLTRRTVVGHDDDHGVVALAQLVERRQDPAELRVRVGQEPGVDLHHAGSDPALVGVHVVPVGHVRRWCGQLGAGCDDAKRDLAFQRRAAPLVPAGVELAGVGVAPLGGDVVGRVAGAHAEPDQERPLGLVAPQLAHTGDGLVGQVLAQVVALVGGAGRVDVGVVADQLGRPVVRVAAEEPVVVLEALAERPVLERPRRRALVAWGQVPLADGERRVALRPQDLCERARLVGDARRVAREGHRQVGQHADTDAVVVAPGQQARPGGRADRGGVEVGQPHSLVGQPVDRWGRDVGAVAAELGEADVVEHDDHHVRRTGSVGLGGALAGGGSGGELDAGARVRVVWIWWHRVPLRKYRSVLCKVARAFRTVSLAAGSTRGW